MRPIIILSILSLIVGSSGNCPNAVDWEKEDYSATKMLQLWEQRTAGKPAAGKTAIFS